jgi:hypothetical protein
VRQRFLLLGLLAALLLSVVGFAGCTSLLGSFEVATTDTPGDGGGGVDACTVCNNQCVDLTTSALNCGTCGRVCQGGQTCQASACACPTGQAYCGGSCVTADRQHCGTACSACAVDQICGATSCTIAPLPAFESTPRDPTGWQDETGAPIAFKLKVTGAPGTIYECRTGPDATFTASTPEWKPCDGAAGTSPTHVPVADATTPEGTYRTEYRYRSDTFRSEPVQYLFYAHHSLDKVASCPRPGQPADGPHFSDDQYFKAAVDYSVANGGPFATPDVFPVPGARATDPFVIRGASIKIPFKGVHLVTTANAGPFADPDWGAVPAGTAFDPALPIIVKTLHHKYVLNPSRSLMLVRRQYINPIKHDCKNQMRFGSSKAKRFGPAALGRGMHYLDCEAFVLDVHGQALCMGKDAAGTAPAPQLIDTRVDVGAGWNHCLLTGAAAGQTVLSAVPGVGGPSTCFTSSWNNEYIEIPSGSGHWYLIVAGASTSLTITPGLLAPVANVPYRYAAGVAPRKDYVVPSGFAHLLHSGHKYGGWGWTPPGGSAPIIPASNRSTKCETVGCANAATMPWMTYLPP